jgi:hypothetical protein
MTTTRRNVMWPLLVMAVGCIWLLKVAGAVPDAVGDILLRAWPALLILFGFDVLFGRRRLRLSRLNLEMSLVGLAVVLVLLAGIVWFAYQKQADTLRTDNVQTFSQDLPAEVARVRVEATLDRTAVTVNPVQGSTLSAEFKGSRESDVRLDWSVDGEAGILRISETHPNSIPQLEDYGRGTLVVSLPADVVIELFSLNSTRGDVTADLQPLRVEQLDLTIDKGNLAIHLPSLDVLQGKLKTGSGSVELFVPQTMALILQMHGGSDLQYDTLRYDLLEGGKLKRVNTQAFQISLDVWGSSLIVTDLP